MRFIELFAGIGGFRLGLERQGHKCVWANEWLEKPRGNYEYNFGERPDPRDITTIPSSDVPDAELITGGFPCATFSVAGKRTGFGIEDTRGTLCFEMFRIAHEGNIPYILFENVKGLLNHDNGRTFEVILCALDELGYDCQWEVPDSQYFGVPQHRERIFLIGHLRKEPRLQVFPIGETSATYEIQGIAKQGNGKRIQAQVSATLDAHYWKGGGGSGRNYVVEQWRRGGFREYQQEGIPTLMANMGTGGHNVPFIRNTAEGLRIAEATNNGYSQPAQYGDGVNIDFPNSKTRRGRVIKGASHTLMASSTPSVVDNAPFIKPCLTPDRDKRQQGRRFKEDGEPAFTLGAQDRHGILIETEETTAIRKLTPLECERLQGLPDDFTKYRIQNGVVIKNSDAERYERCGRTVTIPVIEAIGMKLANGKHLAV